MTDLSPNNPFLYLQGANFSEEQRYTILQPQFELNPTHPLIKKLSLLRTSDPKLAVALTEQLFANAMVSAGGQIVFRIGESQ